VAGAAVELTQGSPEQKIKAAVAAVLGIDRAEIDAAYPSHGFLALGGDSMGAVRLASLLLEYAGASPPVSALLDPGATLASLAAELERLAAGGEGGPSFEQIHGPSPAQIQAADLTLERFLGPLPPAGPIGDRPAQSRVLLTGAAGFLGRFLLLELLEQGAEVSCLIRAADDRAAKARLWAAIGAGPLRDRVVAAGGERVEVIAGDLGKPRLGLGAEAHHRLADRIDRVLHNGALVNHALGYRAHFEPNVAGAAEIARLAITGATKPIALVSTLGVAAGVVRPAPVTEAESAIDLWSARGVGAGERYGVGYSSSKWAAEVLLGRLADRGVPLQVFRCGMILPHPALPEANRSDQLSRLLFGIARTGLAPRSFYAGGYAGPRHYDGIPVDLVASFIVRSCLGATGSARYHLSNARWDDGVSIDRLVDWVESVGVALRRLPFDEWYPAFRAKLEALDERARRRSPLSIVDRWSSPIDRPPLVVDNQKFRGALSERLGHPDVPSLDEAYLHHGLSAICAEE
jgi:fatty acid CoA ligase FadD9